MERYTTSSLTDVSTQKDNNKIINLLFNTDIELKHMQIYRSDRVNRFSNKMTVFTSGGVKRRNTNEECISHLLINK